MLQVPLLRARTPLSGPRQTKHTVERCRVAEGDTEPGSTQGLRLICERFSAIRYIALAGSM